MTKPCTPHEVLRIRELYAKGWSQGRLAREFRRTVGTIGRIVRGETHQEIPMIDSEVEASAHAAKQKFLDMVTKEAIDRQKAISEQLESDLEKARILKDSLDEIKGDPSGKAG